MERLKQQLVFQKVRQIWEQTQTDPAYAKLFDEMALLEPKFEAVMVRLPDDEEDIVRDYVMQCEAMSYRMLECACEQILFPPET